MYVYHSYRYNTLYIYVLSNSRGGYFGMELTLLQYTKKEADKLNLVGYVMNSRDGTVVGTVQGPEDKVREM